VELKMMLPNYMTDRTVIKKRLIDLLPTMIKIFDSEPAVLRIDDEPVMIVGDIHGNLHALDILVVHT
jgi:serine/threonine-protein phosphatase PP1 catalytic subunit